MVLPTRSRSSISELRVYEPHLLLPGRRFRRLVVAASLVLLAHAKSLCVPGVLGVTALPANAHGYPGVQNVIAKRK
jgi:hypothetical protein